MYTSILVRNIYLDLSLILKTILPAQKPILKLQACNLPSKPKICNITKSLHPDSKCYLCSQLIPLKTNLIKHHNRKHKGHPKKFACEYCDKNWIHEVMLNSHKQNEHDIFVCARCNNQFHGKEELNEHIRKKHCTF